METYDIIMLLVLAVATVFGARKGLAWQVASISSIVASYFIAYRFREPVAAAIKADPPWNTFLAMLILYLSASAAIWLAFRFVSELIDRVRLKEFDHHAGAVLGFCRGILWCVIITLFAVTLLGESQRQKIVQSKSGHYIAVLLDRSEAVMPAELQGVLQHPTCARWTHVWAAASGRVRTAGSGSRNRRLERRFAAAFAGGRNPRSGPQSGRQSERPRGRFGRRCRGPLAAAIPGLAAGSVAETRRSPGRLVTRPEFRRIRLPDGFAIFPGKNRIHNRT